MSVFFIAEYYVKPRTLVRGFIFSLLISILNVYMVFLNRLFLLYFITRINLTIRLNNCYYKR